LADWVEAMTYDTEENVDKTKFAERAKEEINPE
jgi:hypothetical protein